MPTNDAPQSLQHPSLEKDKRSRRKLWVWLLIPVVGLCALASSIYFGPRLFTRFKKHQSEEYLAGRLEKHGAVMEWDGLSYFRRVRGGDFSRTNGRSPMDEGDIMFSQGLSSLEELVLRGTAVEDDWLRFFDEKSTLETLDLAETKVGDKGMAHVANLTRLGHLDLCGTKITDAGLAHIVRLTRLRKLMLADTAITDQGLVHLHQIRSLQSVDLRGTVVTDAGAAALQQALPQLKIER